MIKELWKIVEFGASLAILIMFGIYVVFYVFEPTTHTVFENAVIFGLIFLVDVNMKKLKRPE